MLKIRNCNDGGFTQILTLLGPEGPNQPVNGAIFKLHNAKQCHQITAISVI